MKKKKAVDSFFFFFPERERDRTRTAVISIFKGNM